MSLKKSAFQKNKYSVLKNEYLYPEVLVVLNSSAAASRTPSVSTLIAFVLKSNSESILL